MAILSGMRGKRLRYALALTGATAWILQGYDQALMNGLLTLPTFENSFPQIKTNTPELRAQNSTLQGTTVALYEVGAAFGALACYFLGDRYGRKWTTFGGAIVVLVGVILQATSFQLAQLIVARIVTGESATLSLGQSHCNNLLQAWAWAVSQPQSRLGLASHPKRINEVALLCLRALLPSLV